MLKVLAYNGVEPKTMVKLYKCYLRPLAEYGSAAFIASPNAQMDRLKRIQNEAIRVCLNLPSYIRTDLLHEYSGLEPIYNRLLRMNVPLLQRMRQNNVHIAELISQNLNGHEQGLKSPIEMIMSHAKKN